MTATICNDQEIVFSQYDLGFHNKKFESGEFLAHEDEYGADYISLQIKEFTSEHEDFFGVNYSMYGLVATTRYVSFVTEDVTHSRTFLGEFAKVEHAIRFAHFVLNDYKENRFAACPVTDWDHFLCD